jgi:hypothetical protein
MTYQLTQGDTILRIADDAFIPPDPENLDYQEYQDWLAAGNTPDPYVPPEKPPEPTLKEKLDTLGIPIADLKAALEALQ